MAITVLGILNQKYHQECDDRRTRVDDQLPRKLNIGPATPQTMIIKAAMMNAAGWPVARAVHLAKWEKGMGNKSRCQLLSARFIAERQRVDLKTVLPAASHCSLASQVTPSYSLPAIALPTFCTASPVFRRAFPLFS